MSTVSTSLKLDAEMKDRVQKLAASRKRTPHWLMKEAVEQYVEREEKREQFARDIETYEWAAAHLEALGGEAARLRPQLVIANLKRWTLRELDLRREAASASELKEATAAVESPPSTAPDATVFRA